MLDIIMKALGFMAIIVAGYVFKRRGYLTKEHGHALGFIISHVTLPCALVPLANTMQVTPSLLQVLMLGIVANLVAIAYAYLTEDGRAPRERALAMLNMGGYSIGSFALPFVQSFFPPAYMAYVCLFDIGNSLMCLGGTFTLASMVANPDRKVTPLGVLRQLLSSVPFCTYVVIFVLAVLRVPVPDRVLIMTNIAGNANPFLSMLMIGILLELRMGERGASDVRRYVLTRYVITALVAVAVVLLMPLEPYAKRVVVILLSAPVAQMAPIFSAQIDPESEVSATVNSISILVSVVVMPLLVLLLS